MRHPVTFGDLSVQLLSRAAAEEGDGRKGRADVESRQIGHGGVSDRALPEADPEIRPRLLWSATLGGSGRELGNESRSLLWATGPQSPGLS